MSSRVGLTALFPSALSLLMLQQQACATTATTAADKHHVKVDTLIVGGGICGLTTALYLSNLGKRVMLVEREEIGGPFQASSVNSGILETFFDFNISSKVAY